MTTGGASQHAGMFKQKNRVQLPNEERSFEWHEDTTLTMDDVVIDHKQGLVGTMKLGFPPKA